MAMGKRKKLVSDSNGRSSAAGGRESVRSPAKGTFVVQRRVSDDVLRGRLSFTAGPKAPGPGDRDVIVMSGEDPRLADAMERMASLLPEALKRRRGVLSEERIEKIIEAIEPDDPMDLVERRLDEENATLRLRFVGEIPCLTSEQIHKLAGHGGLNPSQTASAWKRSGRIFSVPFRNRQLYPAFEFADGEPKPVIKKILAALPANMTAWQTAFWFVTGNGWLDGAAPKDVLGDEYSVLEAARMEAREVVG
jgi:hypothetical protein